MPGPYSGLTVIEFGRFIAAPYCGQLLADGGADVIKIEPLEGDDARRNGTRLGPTEARQFLNKNRNKRSVAVNLRDPEVAAVIRSLAAKADVIIVNFRPGQGEKLGLDYASLKAANPQVIYAQNTAFGDAGPLAGKAGMDALLQGYTGLAPLGPGGPQMLTDPMVDYTAALLMAWGIATALYHRERRGEGQKLDVSLLQAALVIQNNSINHIDAVDGWRHEFVEYVKQAFARGATFEEILAHRDSLKPAISPPYYGFFRTADGIIALGAGGRGLQKKVAETLGINDPTMGDAGHVPDDIAAHTRTMREASSAALAAQTTAHWLAIFETAGVPVGIVQLKDQVLDDEQAWANGYLTRIEHPSLGGMTVVAPPVQFSAAPLTVHSPPPLLGEHTRAVFQESGVSDTVIDTLAARGDIVV